MKTLTAAVSAVLVLVSAVVAGVVVGIAIAAVCYPNIVAAVFGIGR